MATTTVSDAVVSPQAKGTGLSSEDDNVDAASASLLSSHVGGEYVGEGMGFTRDDGNNEIDVGAGYCYIIDDSGSTSGDRGTGGNPQIQSTSSSGYDIEIPNNQVYLVVFPTTATVSVSDNTLSQIWVNITDVSSNNAVELRSDSGGGTTSTPSDTFLKLGEINDSNSGDPAARSSEGWRPLDAATHLTDSENSTTNTTFGEISNVNRQSVGINYDRYRNIPWVGEIAASHEVALLENDTANESTIVRSYDINNSTELARATITGDTFGPVSGPITRISGLSGTAKVSLQWKVTGGTGQRKGESRIVIYGRPR